MNMKKCESMLHFYDADKYDECPYCSNKISYDKNTDSLNNQVTIAKRETEKLDIDELILSSGKNQIGVSDLDSGMTIGFYSNTKGNNFVTGWIVCIEGNDKGRDFRLFHGFNKIGRDRGMDAVIDDEYVSRNTHCSIVYEDKKNVFYIVPNGGNLTYLNDVLVSESKELKTGDIITIGKSEFDFIAFCREDRKW
ncbi:MAG: FHA domain-containing protein [Lachnospiraceae bacterium]|nr:FHA domain-containing protein [Lachnospiraceae bacterium]